MSGGLHGVGISVVNALSESLDLEIRRDGHVWRQSYERGDPVGPLTQGEATADTGTIITFLPDGDIFEETDYSFETLAQRLREMAFLTRGLRIELIDERAGGEKADFQFEGGIADFILYVNERQGPRPQGRHLLRERDRRGPGRGGDAVERLAMSSPRSRSPTTSTPTRAARTSPASSRR